MVSSWLETKGAGNTGTEVTTTPARACEENANSPCELKAFSCGGQLSWAGGCNHRDTAGIWCELK